MTWHDDAIQFPRLLAEIRAIGLTDEQYQDLATSMDLNQERLDELLERAEIVWERIKERTGPDGYQADTLASEPVYAIHRATVEHLAGRPVTDDELERVSEALDHSSLPDVIGDVVFAVTGSVAGDEEEV